MIKREGNYIKNHPHLLLIDLPYLVEVCLPKGALIKNMVTWTAIANPIHEKVIILSVERVMIFLIFIKNNYCLINIGLYFLCPFVLILRQAQHKYKRTKKSSRWLFFNTLHSWNKTVSAISASCITVPLFKFASLYQNNRRQEKKTNLFFKMKACIREWLYWTKTWVPWGSSVEITETVRS